MAAKHKFLSDKKRKSVNEVQAQLQKFIIMNCFSSIDRSPAMGEDFFIYEYMKDNEVLSTKLIQFIE